MNRSDLQALTDIRAREAELLLTSGAFEGAYYLLGYAIECALKARIAKQIKEHDFPDRKLVVDSYTHDLSKLLALSGLKVEFDKEAGRSSVFAVNWNVVKDWSENSRYAVHIPERRVRDFFSAVLDQTDGVLRWLKTWW